ncbi:MAG: Dehydrogenase, partial [Acidobacteria bacterium]|nr:Dehydrogenase [Acidobacteriota bacterium]
MLATAVELRMKQREQTMEKTLLGKTAIVTGATSGIGLEIAKKLAGMGANMIIPCRDKERGKTAADLIAREKSSNTISVMSMDTSSRNSICDFITAFRRENDSLHILINNAGISLPKRRLNSEGLEMVFATNVLGYFRLTCGLSEILAASAPARVVNVASTFAGEFDLSDLQYVRRKYDAMSSYKQSKACNRMLTRAFSRRLFPKGVTVNSMAPGLVITGLYRELGLWQKTTVRVMGRLFGRTAEEGADTAVWLAADTAAAGLTGGFYEKRVAQKCQFEDRDAEEALFSECAKLSTA